MKISKIARREAKELFRACFVNGLLDENRARQAVSQVLQSKPRTTWPFSPIFNGW
jgi:hypothetical protein